MLPFHLKRNNVPEGEVEQEGRREKRCLVILMSLPPSNQFSPGRFGGRVKNDYRKCSCPQVRLSTFKCHSSFVAFRLEATQGHHAEVQASFSFNSDALRVGCVCVCCALAKLKGAGLIRQVILNARYKVVLLTVPTSHLFVFVFLFLLFSCFFLFVAFYSFFSHSSFIRLHSNP